MSAGSFKKANGRPPKYDSEIAGKVIEFIRHGNYVETAAAAAGLSKVTLYEWLKKGARSKDGEFREFLNAVEKAQAEAEARDVLLISKAAQECWQAAAWRLERKFPDRWGRKDTLTVLQKIIKEVENLSDTDLLALLGYGDGVDDQEAGRTGVGRTPRPGDG
jgi:transposase